MPFPDSEPGPGLVLVDADVYSEEHDCDASSKDKFEEDSRRLKCLNSTPGDSSITSTESVDNQKSESSRQKVGGRGCYEGLSGLVIRDCAPVQISCGCAACGRWKTSRHMVSNSSQT